MNLERLEELCLNYLRQSPQPLVSIEALLQHCRMDEALKGVARQDVLEFLRHHHDITVLEGMEADRGEASLLQGIGLETGPRAVLNVRVPSPLEMRAIFLQQLDQMCLTLNSALSGALDARETDRAALIREMLRRTETLRAKMERLV